MKKVKKISEKAELLRILGHPIRLRILEELHKGIKCVSDIQELLDISQPNISQHLALLRRYGLVDYFEDGQLRCYYLCKPELVEALFDFINRPYPSKPPEKATISKTHTFLRRVRR